MTCVLCKKDSMGHWDGGVTYISTTTGVRNDICKQCFIKHKELILR